MNYPLLAQLCELLMTALPSDLNGSEKTTLIEISHCLKMLYKRIPDTKSVDVERSKAKHIMLSVSTLIKGFYPYHY